MAGEKSKSIGEYGEKIGRSLLDLLGWKDTIRNISITCNLGDEHKNDKGNPKQSHGDDELFVYDCPFFSDRRVAVHVSIKHSEQYNPNEGKLKAKIKSDLIELSEIIECSKYSVETDSILNGISTERPDTKHFGLLVYTSHHKQQLDKNVTYLLNHMIFNEKINDTIYMVDNDRANFLFEVHRYLNSNYDSFKYTNPNFGFSLLGDQDNHTNFITLNMLNSDILPFRVDVDGCFEIILFCKDEFSEDSLKKGITYAFEISQGFTKKISIGFPDFNYHTHKSADQTAKRNFSNENQNIDITIETFCFLESFLTSEINK